MQIINPFIVTLTSLILVSCTTPLTPGARAPISKLQTSNLVKNPQTGVYRVAVANTNNALARLTPKTNSTVTNLEPGNVVHPPVTVTSIDIPTPEGVPVKAEHKPKTDWARLGMYYLIVLHLLVVGYYLYDRRVFEKITTPFVKKAIPAKPHPTKRRTAQPTKKRQP